MNSAVHVIAIDGPSGSGKSTIAKILANDLNLTYQDTGSMFRALGFFLNRAGIDFSAEVLTEDIRKKIQKLLESISFEYCPSKSILISINGENLTEIIREHQVSTLASHVSKHQVVRDYLREIQRKLAQGRPSILDGRDIGTVIFPDAFLKIYLVASSSVRAQRRYDQLLEKDPVLKESLSVSQIKEDIDKRDCQDANRKIAPLKKADDAIEIDSGELTIPEVVEKIKELYQQRMS